MSVWRRLFRERYDPEQDERVQTLHQAAQEHHEQAEAAKRRRNILVDSMLGRQRSDEGDGNGARR
jgi:hypothetical protein